MESPSLSLYLFLCQIQTQYLQLYNLLLAYPKKPSKPIFIDNLTLPLLFFPSISLTHTHTHTYIHPKQGESKMCNNMSTSPPLYFALGSPSKRKNVRVHCLKSRRRSLAKEAREKGMVGERRRMEIKNLKLYKDNQSIMRENEKLKKKADLLQQENRGLLSQLQNKYSVPQTHLAHSSNI